MNATIATHRSAISLYAPRIITIQINKEKIRDVIGQGGKTIRSIVERTGCKIEVHDDGRVDIASSDEIAAQKAVAIIKELTAEAELGKTYLGKVVRVVNFGAFVEVLPGVEGLVHISEIAEHRTKGDLEDRDDVSFRLGELRMGAARHLPPQGSAPGDRCVERARRHGGGLPDLVPMVGGDLFHATSPRSGGPGGVSGGARGRRLRVSHPWQATRRR
jgi:hypothetical protein